MRNLMTLGVCSLATVLAFTGCGDDDGGNSTGGTGGMAGSAGSSGSAGTAGGGMGGSAGSAGSAGMAGSAGTTGMTAITCTGCVELTVPIPATPVTATGSQAGFVFSAAATDAPFDLTNVTTITWRIQVISAETGYVVQPVLQTAPPEDPAYAFGAYPAQVALTPAAFPAGEWVDVPIDVSALAGAIGGDADAGVDAGEADAGPATLTAFDKSKVRSITLNVGALATAGEGIASIVVDSVTVTGTSNFTTKTFDTDAEGLTLNMFQVPPGTQAPIFH
jgi:hypothetical protein